MLKNFKSEAFIGWLRIFLKLDCLIKLECWDANKTSFWRWKTFSVMEEERDVVWVLAEVALPQTQTSPDLSLPSFCGSFCPCFTFCGLWTPTIRSCALCNSWHTENTEWSKSMGLVPISLTITQERWEGRTFRDGHTPVMEVQTVAPRLYHCSHW